MTLGHFGALGRTVSAVSLSAYLSHRDGSHALRAPPLWEGNSNRFAARVWDLSLRGRASRGKKVRHIWELRWHGEIKAITDPANGAALSRCGLCAHPSCSLAHIFFEQASIMTLFTSQNGSHLSSSLASCPALFSQHLWLGHYPPPLSGRSSAYYNTASLLRLGHRVTQAYRDIRDSYGEALSAAQSPPPEIDFSAEPPSPSQVTPLTSSIAPSPLPNRQLPPGPLG